MVRLFAERVLLIGDADQSVAAALAQAVPDAQVTAVPTVFDALAELAAPPGPAAPARFSAVLAAAEPIERRPEAAVRALRHLAGEARLLLFGHPTLEILSRKMMEFGCDDYLVMPASATELEQVFGSAAPALRLAQATPAADAVAAPVPEPAAPGGPAAENVAEAATAPDPPVAAMVLDALLRAPQDAPAAVVRDINAQLAPAGLELRHARPNQPPPTVEGRTVLVHPLRVGDETFGSLHLLIQPGACDEAAARHRLAQWAALIAKAAALQDRHNRLQKLAITDELTGLYNARYFRHFLSLIIERARKLRFPVTLLLFDIDDFKRYNDQYGHGTGDDILRQAGALMRRCTRQHDLVARIGGDEFAVVFWDKEGPRQPRDPRPGQISRPPQEPLQIFERFRGLISSEEFPLLGQTGKGVLTVSAGLAVFPYEANNADDLIREADRALMQGAKRNGKNAIFLVGTDDPTAAPAQVGDEHV